MTNTEFKHRKDWWATCKDYVESSMSISFYISEQTVNYSLEDKKEYPEIDLDGWR